MVDTNNKQELMVAFDNSHQSINELVSTVKTWDVMRPEHINFLQMHTKDIATVMEKSYMWRTQTQKRSIINDVQCPTTHAKFHQAILEQKVQFEQTMYLARDFEMEKLEMQELELDIEDIKKEQVDENGELTRRGEIALSKKSIELKYKMHSLSQMTIAMDYRMKEIMGWQEIIDELLNTLRVDENMSDEVIWDKDAGYVYDLFLRYMTRYAEIGETTDPGSANNITSIAIFAVQTMLDLNMLDDAVISLNIVQKRSLLNILQMMGRFDKVTLYTKMIKEASE